MKAELIAEEVFTVKVGDHKTERLRVASRWNGLMELRAANGDVLVVSAPERSGFGGAFDTLFNDVFRTARETRAAGTVIVMGSPDLVSRLRAAAEAVSATPPAPPANP